MTEPSDEAQQAMTVQQAQLAADGMALGQCTECGSYRADGKPPIIHGQGCSHANDYLSPDHWYWQAKP